MRLKKKFATTKTMNNDDEKQLDKELKDVANVAWSELKEKFDFRWGTLQYIINLLPSVEVCWVPSAVDNLYDCRYSIKVSWLIWYLNIYRKI